jgi:hypothetical protein
MPASRRSVFCLLNRAACWKKATRLYLFLMLGINYQFYLHSRLFVGYTLNPLQDTPGFTEICNEKHSKKSIRAFWVVWWTLGQSKASLIFDGFYVRSREQCLYTAACEEGNPLPIPSWLQQGSLAGVATDGGAGSGGSNPDQHIGVWLDIWRNPEREPSVRSLEGSWDNEGWFRLEFREW